MLLKSRKVLVLNKSWLPVGVISLESALKKIFSTYANKEPRAKIIDCNNEFRPVTWGDWSNIKPGLGEPAIRSSNDIFRIPTVIQVTRYNKLPDSKKRRSRYCRRTIYKRDDYTCQYCGCRPGSSELSIDHVIPKSQGGETIWENCVLACVECNSKKANRTPKEANMRLLKKPVRPKSNLLKGDLYRIKDWEAFLGAAYWLTELENDES